MSETYKNMVQGLGEFSRLYGSTHTVEVKDGTRVGLPAVLPKFDMVQVTGLADYDFVLERVQSLGCRPVYVVDQGKRRALVYAIWARYAEPTAYDEFVLSFLCTVGEADFELCPAGDFGEGSARCFGFTRAAFLGDQVVQVPYTLALQGPFAPLAIETGREWIGYPKFAGEVVFGQSVRLTEPDIRTELHFGDISQRDVFDFTRGGEPSTMDLLRSSYHVMSWLDWGQIFGLLRNPQPILALHCVTPEVFGSERFSLHYVVRGKSSASLYSPVVHGKSPLVDGGWFQGPLAALDWQPRLIQKACEAALSVPTTALPVSRLRNLLPISESPIDNPFLLK